MCRCPPAAQGGRRTQTWYGNGGRARSMCCKLTPRGPNLWCGRRIRPKSKPRVADICGGFQRPTTQQANSTPGSSAGAAAESKHALQHGPKAQPHMPRNASPPAHLDGPATPRLAGAEGHPLVVLHVALQVALLVLVQQHRVVLRFRQVQIQ